MIVRIGEGGKVPKDPFEEVDAHKWQWYGQPRDGGQVFWKRMEHRSPKERQKQHDEWDKYGKKGK